MPFARLVVLALLVAAGSARGDDVLRPELGKFLQAAQESIKAGKYRSALSSLRAADGVPDRTPYENYVLERMRASAAVAAGESAIAKGAFEALLASGRLQAAEQLPVLESLAGAAYAAKDYGKALAWADRYFSQGGDKPSMRSLRASALYITGDFVGVVRDLEQRIEAAEKAQSGVDEAMLRMLAASHAKLGNDAGYAAALEKLLLHHPKKEYWADRLARLGVLPGFSDRLLLDVYRLKLATGTLQESAEFVEMAQLALQAGLPGEARRVIELGYSAGRLGSGQDAARHQRLRDMAIRQASEDIRALEGEAVGRSAEAMVATGQALVSIGQIDRGIKALEQGLARGGLKRPDEARLHLGQAYLRGAQREKAIETFSMIRADHGLVDLARLWALYGQSRVSGGRK